MGPRDKEVEKYDDFCEVGLNQKVCDAKSLFDGTPNDEFRRARNRSNPFESLKKG